MKYREYWVINKAQKTLVHDRNEGSLISLTTCPSEKYTSLTAACHQAKKIVERDPLCVVSVLRCEAIVKAQDPAIGVYMSEKFE